MKRCEFCNGGNTDAGRIKIRVDYHLLILYDDIRDWELPDLSYVFQVKPESKNSINLVIKILNDYFELKREVWDEE